MLYALSLHDEWDIYILLIGIHILADNRKQIAAAHFLLREIHLFNSLLIKTQQASQYTLTVKA